MIKGWYMTTYGNKGSYTLIKQWHIYIYQCIYILVYSKKMDRQTEMEVDGHSFKFTLSPECV